MLPLPSFGPAVLEDVERALLRAANLALASTPRFIITGSGRCGTAYAAKRLTDLGIRCSHEGYFTPAGPRLRNPDRMMGTRGDASWLAAPYAGWGDFKVVHLVRAPRDVVHSFHSIGFFDRRFRDYHRPFIAFAERFFEVGDDPLDACIRWYLEWNLICEEAADIRIRIEDFEQELPRLFRFIGIEPSLGASPPSRSFNKRPSVYSVSPGPAEVERRLLDHRRADAIAAMASRYGYPMCSTD